LGNFWGKYRYIFHTWSIWDLVGGAITILKNDGVRQWEGLLQDHPIYIYMMENKKNVPTPQPDNNSLT